MSSDAFKAITLERILTKENLVQALRKVEVNKGSSGVDGMRADELRRHLFEHRGELNSAIRMGTYRPSPIKRVYIPKDNGEKDTHSKRHTVQLAAGSVIGALSVRDFISVFCLRPKYNFPSSSDESSKRTEKERRAMLCGRCTDFSSLMTRRMSNFKILNLTGTPK